MGRQFAHELPARSLKNPHRSESHFEVLPEQHCLLEQPCLAEKHCLSEKHCPTIRAAKCPAENDRDHDHDRDHRCEAYGIGVSNQRHGQ